MSAGEKATQFKNRLQKRLSHLKYLEQMTQSDLESQAELVRIVRDQVGVKFSFIFYILIVTFHRSIHTFLDISN
jgi:type I site-specific restriction endonuclease